jgi:hypothetical protein
VLLRPGAISREEIEASSESFAQPAGEKISSPGQMRSHYAPRARMRLNATDARADEALLAFGPHVPAGARVTRNLSARGDLVEAAANLFAMLRELDASGAASIAVMPIPEHGLGEAINDRLRRAAAPREARHERRGSRAAEIGRRRERLQRRPERDRAASGRMAQQISGPHAAAAQAADDGRSLRHPRDLQRNAHAIVPQGGNTGLVGGQIPLNGEVLLSLARMNAIRQRRCRSA